MLFRDRLEVWSPGCMPHGITPDKLRIKHKSVPVNPVIATPVYLAGYIEHLGTGTLDIIKKCEEKGLRTPTFELDEDVVITIWRKNIYQKDLDPQNDPQRTTGKQSGKRKILLMNPLQKVAFKS